MNPYPFCTDPLKMIEEKQLLTEKKISDSQIKYTNKILSILEPILSDYVNKNQIDLLLNQKNIVIGKKNLDITDNIVLLLDKEIDNLKFEF